MITYQEEKITNKILDEAEGLMKETVEETGSFGKYKFKLNKMLYIKLSNIGMYVSYTAREDGELIGFVVMTCTEHPYFEGVVMSQQDVLHLSKSHRKGWTGVKLLKFCEKKLKERGVTHIMQNSTNKIDLGNLFCRLGYSESDKVYLKEM